MYLVGRFTQPCRWVCISNLYFSSRHEKDIQVSLLSCNDILSPYFLQKWRFQPRSMLFITNKHNSLHWIEAYVVDQAQAVFRLSLSSRFLRERNYSVITDADPRSSRVDPDPGKNKWLHSNRKKEMHVISPKLFSRIFFRVSLHFHVPKYIWIRDFELDTGVGTLFSFLFFGGDSPSILFLWPFQSSAFNLTGWLWLGERSIRTIETRTIILHTDIVATSLFIKKAMIFWA